MPSHRQLLVVVPLGNRPCGLAEFDNRREQAAGRIDRGPDSTEKAEQQDQQQGQREGLLQRLAQVAELLVLLIGILNLATQGTHPLCRGIERLYIMGGGQISNDHADMQQLILPVIALPFLSALVVQLFAARLAMAGAILLAGLVAAIVWLARQPAARLTARHS